MADTPLIYGRMADILADVTAIGKDRKNPQQGYSFRGIDDFLDALHPLLAKHRVFPSPKYTDLKREERQTARGGTLTYTTVTGEVTFYAEDGSSVTTNTIGEGMDSGDKSSNKAMSAAYKYALMQTFAVPVGLAIDSETDTPEPSEPAPRRPQPPQRPDTQANRFYNGEPKAPVPPKDEGLLLAKQALWQKALRWCANDATEAKHIIEESAATIDADLATINGVRDVADALHAQYEASRT